MNARCLALMIAGMIAGAFAAQEQATVSTLPVPPAAAAPAVASTATTSAPSLGSTTPPDLATIATYVFADTPAVKMHGSLPDPKFLKRHAYYLQLARDGRIDAYFVGDSVLDAWQAVGAPVWKREFAGWNLGNFACSGDCTQHALWRLLNGELRGVRPKIFVVLIGTNNLYFNTNEQIVSGNRAIVDVLRKTNPQAKILLLGIFPRADEKPARIEQLNTLLAKLADGKSIRYLNPGRKFLDDKGNLRKELMLDGIHPNEKGYELFAQEIKPVLREVLGPPDPNARPRG